METINKSKIIIPTLIITNLITIFIALACYMLSTISGSIDSGQHTYNIMVKEIKDIKPCNVDHINDYKPILDRYTQYFGNQIYLIPSEKDVKFCFYKR